MHANPTGQPTNGPTATNQGVPGPIVTLHPDCVIELTYPASHGHVASLIRMVDEGRWADLHRELTAHLPPVNR